MADGNASGPPLSSSVIRQEQMTEKVKKSIFESLMSVSIDGSKSMADDFPSWFRPIARIFFFCLILISSIIIGPIILLLRVFRKSKIDPFFKLRTELETKWYGGSQDEALSELREIGETLNNSEMKIFLKGVRIPPYGNFKFNEYTKIMWLLYHWEFHSGNFHEASNVCDNILDKWPPKDSKERSTNKYWEEWVLNKAKAIFKHDGPTATQEYLLKFVDTKNEYCRINKYLYEIREESKKIV